MAGFTISDVISLRATAALHPHEANDRVYGAEAPDELIDSVREHGVLEALIVADDGTIIGGHRRWGAASAVGLAQVPCRRIDGDALSLRRALIELNRQRIKSNVVMAHEALELVAIAEIEARQRMADGGRRGRAGEKGVVSETTPCNESRKARDDVAKTLDVSPSKAGNLITVGRALEALEQSAAPDAAQKAEALRSVLDERGAAPAAALAREQTAGDSDVRQQAVRLLLHGDGNGGPVGETEVARRLGVSVTQVREWHIMARISATDPLIRQAAELVTNGTVLNAIGPAIGKSVLWGRCYVWVAREYGLIAGDVPTTVKAPRKPRKPKVKDYPTAGPVPAEQSFDLMKPTRKTGGAWAIFIMSVIEFLRMAAEADGQDIWRQWPEESRERVAERMEMMAAELTRLAGRMRAIKLTLVK